MKKLKNKYGYLSALKYLSIISLFFFLGCNSSIKKEEDNTRSLDTNSILKESVSTNQQWMNAINNKHLRTLKELYAEDIYRLSSNGIDISNRDTLISIVANNNVVVKQVNTIKRINANSDYDYEIGSFKNATNGLMKYIVIWDTSHDSEKRVLEFFSEADEVSVDLKQIDAQREEWIRLCNAHNAENLINKLYRLNTMYFNHKPMIVGRENLIPVYSYMNSANYKLTLEPIIVEPVSESIVYEIGQCNGSYNGKYILIWQKTNDEWQIVFDSNI